MFSWDFSWDLFLFFWLKIGCRNIISTRDTLPRDLCIMTLDGGVE